MIQRYAGVVLLVSLSLMALGLERRLIAQQATPTMAQAEATRPGVPPSSVPPSETLGWMLALGYVSNWLMRCMKQSSWFPMIRAGAGKINLVLAGLLAALAAAGIHTEYDKVAGTFLITGLTLTSIVHFLGDWLRQWAIQQWTFNTTKTAVEVK